MIIITDDEIEKAFLNTNFGNANHRKLLEQGVLKKQANWISGHTLNCIMKELGLISSKNDEVLVKGRLFIYEAFKDSVHGE